MRNELTCPKWCTAFAKGAQCEIWKEASLQPGAVAMFGTPQRWALLQQAIAEGRTWYYGDHAYFQRHEYYRITRNGYQLHGCAGPGDPLRYEDLGLRVRDWRKDGSHILLCPNSPAYFELLGLDCHEWIRATTAELRRYTGREIRVRFKTDGGEFDQVARKAWAVVCFTSTSGVMAAMEGVASFATAPCASQAFGTGDLSLIERPVRPDNRYEMACVLAANQWTLHEIARGQAWRQLNDSSNR